MTTAAGAPSARARLRAVRSASRIWPAATRSTAASLLKAPTPKPSSTPMIAITSSSSSSVKPRRSVLLRQLVVGDVIFGARPAVGPGREQLEAVELVRRLRQRVDRGPQRDVLGGGARRVAV